ncbi:MAG: ABC transporter permease [Acidobacteriia bacterium]|nr:ABC transporter permease [Terriglobia bacterium]
MRVYRLLLRLFPASFRAEYGEEMQAVFAARRLRETAVALWAGTLIDILANALRVHTDLLWQDLHWTFRVLRQSPGFTLTAITVISLGIGANTAAFTLLNHVFLRPLPFAHPEQLVTVYQTDIPNHNPRTGATPPNFVDWRAMNHSFSSMGAYIGILTPMNLSGQGDPVRLDAATVSFDVFKTLGVQPMAGRSFTAEDDLPGGASAILSNHTAEGLFGSAAGAVGRTVRLDGQPFNIIGVMPPGFAFPWRDTHLWLSLKSWDNRGNRMLSVIGRLRPEVSLTQARADLEVIARQLERAFPKDNAGVGIGMLELREDTSPQARILVIAVSAGAFCLMLIACTNLANLLFARAMVRKQEIAVRIAIGAARERVLRQLLTESMVLGIVGGALGLVLAMLATPSLTILVPGSLPIGGIPEVDWRVFAFAAALTLATSIAFGAGPALRSSRNVDLNALRSRSASGSRTDRLRAALVLAEVACTVTLLIGAGLLLKAMWRVQAVDPGFRAEGVLTLRTALPIATPPDRRDQFYSRILTEARRLPGVTSAAYISFLPMTATYGNFVVTVPGVTMAEETRAHTRFITSDYFKTLGIPLLRGRDVSERDNSTAPKVAVVSQFLAQRLWPGQDPVGREMTLGSNWTVVGVVGDVAVRGLESSSLPQAYFPSGQVPPSLAFYAPKDLAIHASGDPASLASALRQIIRRANPEQAVSDVQLLEDILASQTASRRAQLRVLVTFAGVAFLLAAVGIHGLLSFAVTSRTREVGVRIALGAARGDILGMFLRQGLVLGSAGIAVALPLAYLAARSMTSLLFGVQPNDPLIYASAALLALLMTVAGSLRPSLRAASVDPALTIRAE